MARDGWRARDVALLDALGELPRTALEATAWRVVREGRDPLLCGPSQGRWDRGRFDVLYTSLDPDGALAEMHFDLSRQPVFPTRAVFTLNQIEVRTTSTLRFPELIDLAPLGVDPAGYKSLLYPRTREIGDAAAILGLDGLVAPSARGDCLNLVLFCDHLPPDALGLSASSTIDWDDWRKRHKEA